MKLSLASKREQELIQRIKSTYRESAHFARTLDEHIARMKQYVWETPEYRTLPGWAKSAIHGANDVLFSMLYEVPIDWTTGDAPATPLIAVSIGPDGRMFDRNDDSWLQESSEYKSALQCTHVWRKRWEQGQFKPF